MIRIILILVFLGVFSCKSKNAQSQSADLFKQASLIFKKNPQDKDSLLRAANMLDSAIKLDPKDVRFYLTKVRIFLNLKDYRSVVDVCDRLLTLDKSFFAELTKGVALDMLRSEDSARLSYKNALNVLRLTEFKSEIYKDYQRIILFGLLDNATEFEQSLQAFKKVHLHEPEYPAYFESLTKFDKANYLSSY